MERHKDLETINVAYAEDHRLVRETLVNFLEALGGIGVIIEAGNGKELIEKIRQSDIKPDVCLIDIVMPEMDGFETVRRLKADGNDMKILLLSGHVTEEYFVQMLFAGADGYLTKSQGAEQIRQAILDVHHFGMCNMEHFSPDFIRTVKSNNNSKPELSGKELQLLKLSIKDKTYEEIAALMKMSPKSIEGHRKRLFAKLGVKTRAGLAMYAVRYGYVMFNQLQG